MFDYSAMIIKIRGHYQLGISLYVTLLFFLGNIRVSNIPNLSERLVTFTSDL